MREKVKAICLILYNFANTITIFNINMKPYVICHMMSSVDGRIDCAMTAAIDKTDAYYEILDSLQFDAVLEGRVSRQMHYALPEPFMANEKAPIGEEKYCIAHAMIGGGIDGRRDGCGFRRYQGQKLSPDFVDPQ